MSNKTEYEHVETDEVRSTIIKKGDDPEGEAFFDEYEREIAYRIKMGLCLEDGRGGEFIFILSGFTTLTDPAGDPILYYKVIEGGRGLLYLKTEHPSCDSVFRSVEAFANVWRMQIKDAKTFMKEIDSTMKKVRSGEIKPEDGIHPKMTYLKNGKRIKVSWIGHDGMAANIIV